jgi:hypothetical protein
MSDFSQMPGMGPMNDTLKFMRDLWGGVKTPGMSMPTLSLDDLDKQIADMKAVEGWLALNMHTLKATIQTMEVQRATLSALQAMGQNVGATMGQNMEQAVDAAMNAAGAMAAMSPMAAMASMTGAANGAGTPAGAAAEAARSTTNTAQNPTAGGTGLGRGNGASHGFGGGNGTEPAAGAAGNFSFAPPQAEKPTPPAADEELVDETAAPAGQPAATLASVAAPFVDPAAWWGLLQDQFKQAMESAVAVGSVAPAASDARPTRRAPAKKGAGKSVKKPRSAAAPGGGRKSASKATAGKSASKSAAKKTGAKAAGRAIGKTASKAANKTTGKAASKASGSSRKSSATARRKS